MPAAQQAAIGAKIALPDRPGLGIEIDPAKVEKQTLVEFS